MDTTELVQLNGSSAEFATSNGATGDPKPNDDSSTTLIDEHDFSSCSSTASDNEEDAEEEFRQMLGDIATSLQKCGVLLTTASLCFKTLSLAEEWKEFLEADELKIPDPELDVALATAAQNAEIRSQLSDKREAAVPETATTSASDDDASICDVSQVFESEGDSDGEGTNGGFELPTGAQEVAGADGSISDADGELVSEPEEATENALT